MNQESGEKELFRLKLLWPLIALAFIVLVGYYKVFLGHHFFIHEDWLGMSGQTSGNAFSNGWRPDIGLGISHFYGDPGRWHPWGVLTWLERLVLNRSLSYSISVIGLGTLVTFAIYFLARKIQPRANLWIIILLSPLAVFCFDQPGQHFTRCLISLSVGIPILLWVLYDYFEQPRFWHVFAAAFVFWFVAFFGNLWSLTQLWTLGLVFSFCYRAYFRKDWRQFLFRCAIIYGAAGVMFFLLGAWVFYSFGLEQVVMGFVRDKAIELPGITFKPDLKKLILFMCGFIPFEGIPINHELAAFNILPYHLNVSVIFIFVFLFYLSRRAQNFWEFALKTLLVMYFVHWFFLVSNVLPGYGSVYTFLSNKSSKIFSMYDFVFSLQVLLIICFVATVRAENIVIENAWIRRLQKTIAALTVASYCAVLVIAVLSQYFGQIYLTLSDHIIPSWLPEKVAGYSRELLAHMLAYNARRYQEAVTPQLLIFFFSSIVIAGVFLKDAWLRRAAGLNKILIAGALLFNAFFLVWSLYPLSNKPLVWDEPSIKSLNFEPTDRFFYVRAMKWDKTVEGFQKKWENDLDGNVRRHLVGYLEPPGLNISGLKSFTTSAESDFMTRVFARAGQEYQRLYYGAHFVVSDLLDMAAVKYYYSDGILQNAPSQLVAYARFNQLYIYKNTAAWPYFYLADRVEVLNGTLENPVYKTAYLKEGDAFELDQSASQGTIAMTRFGYGEFEFDFESDREEFLVVNDAWHPFWKVKAGEHEFSVARVNELFKGVKLPAGTYSVKLYFDTRDYRPGIYISVAAWVLFLIGSVFAWRNRHRSVIGWV